MGRCPRRRVDRGLICLGEFTLRQEGMPVFNFAAEHAPPPITHQPLLQYIDPDISRQRYKLWMSRRTRSRHRLMDKLSRSLPRSCAGGVVRVAAADRDAPVLVCQCGIGDARCRSGVFGTRQGESVEATMLWAQRGNDPTAVGVSCRCVPPTTNVASPRRSASRPARGSSRRSSSRVSPSVAASCGARCGRIRPIVGKGGRVV